MNLVIFGIGPLARLMHYYFRHDADAVPVCFCADREYITGPTFCGLPVIPYDESSERCPPDTHRMFVAVAYRRMRV